jgi:hypothetical protein
VTIYVDNDMVDLPEIVVKTNTDLVDNNVLSGSSLIKINTSKMDVVPSLSHNDFTAPLLMLPGIDGSTETSSGFLIRKSSSDKNLVLYDGFNLYQIDHFFGSFSSLNTKAVKDLQVYKGGYDARYGGRTGGMIEITGKSGNMNKPVADVGVDMLSVDASVELPIIKEKLSLIVTGRRSYTDKFQTPLYLKLFENVSYDMEQYYRYTPQAFSSNKSSPLYAYSDLHSKITYKAKENQVFSASFFLGNDKLSFDQLYQYPSISEDGSWTTRGASIRYTGNVSSTWQQDVVLGSSLVDNYFEHYDTTLVVYNRPRLSFVDKRSKYVVMKNKLIDNSLNYFSVFQLHPSHSVQAGLGVSHIQSDFMSSNGVNSIFINKNDTSTDYHLQSSTVSPNFNYTFKNERLMIKPGLRVDVYNVTRKIYPELRLETSYKVTDNFTLKASAGNYHQYVYKVTAGNQMDFQNIWVVADGDKFPVVSSVATSLGCNYSINPTISVDVEFYHRQTSDMTRSFEYYKVGNAGRVTTARRLLTYSNIVDGVDVLVRKSFGAYQVWLAYTLSKSRVKTKKTNNNQVLDALDDQLHECKLFNTIDWKRLRFSASFIVGSGKVWHEVVYAQTNKAAAKTTINVNPLPVYYRTDASITYNRQLGMARLSAGVSVFNVFNNKNVVSVAQKLKNDLASSAALRTAVMQTSDVYGMGRIPNVFVNIKF